MRKIAILLVGLVFLSACQAKVTLHHFVIPQGYTGPIAVVSDFSFSGKGGYWEDNRYVHVVPRTAVVCVSREGMLGAHLLSAEYSDGSMIYSYGMGRVHPPNEKAIRIEGFGSWGGSVKGSAVVWLGVGDAETVEALKKSFSGGGIEDLMPPGIIIQRHERLDFKLAASYCIA